MSTRVKYATMRCPLNGDVSVLRLLVSLEICRPKIYYRGVWWRGYYILSFL